MVIHNGLVLNQNFEFQKCDLQFSSKIEKMEDKIEDAEGIDAADLYVIPGLVDVHTHGAVGFDANPREHKQEYKEYMRQNGITTYFPTMVTDSIENLQSALSDLAADDEWLGFHVEGPFISVGKKGAHNPDFIKPLEAGELELLQKAAKGKIRLMTIAPEVGDNMDYIPVCRELGIRVTLGHSECDFDTAQKAYDLGATQLTHTFNAMKGIHHRNLGLIECALSRQDVFCEMICDGFHVAPEVIMLTYRMLGPDRMVVISDSLSATGLPDGCYQLGGDQEVVVKDRKAYIGDTIAGSTTCLFQMMKNCVSFGISLENAVKMASLTPCRAVGIDDRKGSLKVGKDADILLLSKDLEIRYVFKTGKMVYKAV